MFIVYRKDRYNKLKDAEFIGYTFDENIAKQSALEDDYFYEKLEVIK